MRVLDLGCGFGLDLASWGVKSDDEVTGVDIHDGRLAVARLRFPHRTYIHGRGERLPFEEGRFDRVICAVSLPYMHIPKALAEIHRVLVPGGRTSLSLHSPGFTWHELHQNALPHIVPTIYRLYVMENGVLFHLTGRTVRFINRRIESFQTKRGMKIALNRAGFADPSFERLPGRGGWMFLVEARRN